jgi:perosamine synthetase
MKYYLNEPFLTDLEKKYVLEVIESKWLSSNGKHTKIFEEKFAAYLGLKNCVAVQSGTTALHLVLKALGVGKGDHVLIPNFSCSATISTVIQSGGIPVVMDVELDTYGLDVSQLEIAIQKYSPKVLQLVHVYGFPARDTLKIKELCRKYNVLILEDASEALGATIDGCKAGSIGDVGVFSIRSEKMIGVGEGGVVVTDNDGLFSKIVKIASRSSPFRGNCPYWQKYFCDGEGYNYLLPHLLGAVGRAQIERFETEILPEKVRVGKIYRNVFENVPGIKLQVIASDTSPVYWLNTVLIDGTTENVRTIGENLQEKGIEVRSGFWPLGDMAAFNPQVFGTQEAAHKLFNQLLVLPSVYNLKEEDIKSIKELMLTFMTNELK